MKHLHDPFWGFVAIAIFILVQMNWLHPLVLPPEFDWFPASIYANYNNTRTTTDYDILAVWRPAPGRTVYVGSSGSDKNDGSRGMPLKTLTEALRRPGVTDIALMPGYNYVPAGNLDYSGTLHIRAADPEKLTIIRYGTPAYAYNWTEYDGGAFRAELNYPINSVWDSRARDAAGSYLAIPRMENCDQVERSEQGWSMDDVSLTACVRMKDGSKPGWDPVLLSGYNIRFVSGAKIFFDHVEIEGGRFGIEAVNTTGAAPQIFARNCSVRYADGSNVAMRGAYLAIQKCQLSHSGRDNISYTAALGVESRGIEIGLDSYKAGWHHRGAANNNGSSAHDANTVIRIGGRYHDNYGPNIADAANSSSVIVGVDAFRSEAPDDRNIDFCNENRMIVLNARSWGSVHSTGCDGGHKIVATNLARGSLKQTKTAKAVSASHF